MPTPTSRRRVISLPLDGEGLCLRGLSPGRLRFEVEYGLERGTSANAFFFPGPSPLLVHPPGASFAEPFLAALAQHCDSSTPLRVVVSHVNPNRVALLRRLAASHPQLSLVATNAGRRLLQELWETGTSGQAEQAAPHSPLPAIDVVRSERRLPLGSGSCRLLPLPTPRWPDGLVCFDEATGLLMSGKFFAAHVCSEALGESTRQQLDEDRRYYYDCLMAPMASQVETAVDRLEELPIRAIAPGHGPAILESWRSLISDYRRWGEGPARSSLTVALLFASAYGNTAAIANALAQGVAKAGVRINSVNCEFCSAEELLTAIQRSDALLIGSPTLGGHAPTQIVSALGTLLAEGDRNKPVGVFGSFGWSGEAIDLLAGKLRDGGFRFAFEPIRVRFSPDAATIKTCEEIGTDLAQDLKQQQRKEKRAAGGLSGSRSNPAVLALGRVTGSICILTSRKGSGEAALSGAMVASWVSQASFNPPGLSVAVARDRAVEQLLHVGDRFALNILASGREAGPMKHFLQPFPPGADRFAGMACSASPAGQPLINDALAWLEVQVEQRMECGDHWIIYGTVQQGGLLDEQGLTAVRQRHSGASY